MDKTLYLVRHCRATGQQPDAPLTTEGQTQAIALANLLQDAKVERIVSSPFVRAYQSIVPLAERLGLQIETDNRLSERVLSSQPLDDWRDRLAETFVNLDIFFEGGESSRVAMKRGVAVLDEILQQSVTTSVIVTHGNLMTLILKHFDQRIGYAEWENLNNPDVYYLRFIDSDISIEQLRKFS
jgi:2,3-bisphosphoglycerate-dependent phosphoglycerate mutase